MSRSIQIFIIMLTAVLTAGCVGEVEMSVGDATETDFPSGSVPGKVGDRTNPDTPETQLPPAFELIQETPQLLPFHVRMAKLSRVTGLAQDDPVFDEIWRNRYALGDHNYGQGIGPDLTWSASKMATWVKSIRPVCTSAEMQQTYPSLPEDLNALTMVAYGREVEEADLMIVEDTLAETGTGEAERYEAVCLSILSSLEFVGR